MREPDFDVAWGGKRYRLELDDEQAYSDYVGKKVSLIDLDTGVAVRTYHVGVSEAKLNEANNHLEWWDPEVDLAQILQAAARWVAIAEPSGVSSKPYRNELGELPVYLANPFNFAHHRDLFASTNLTDDQLRRFYADLFDS